MVEKKKYPISVLEDVQKLLQHFYTLEYRYFDVLQMKFNETHLLEIIDRQNPSFKIVISNPHQNKELKTHVKVIWSPQNERTLGEYSLVMDIKNIPNRFIAWYTIIKKYEDISLSKEDFYSKAEEKQFYDEFGIKDEDANISALTVENQIRVYKLLENLQSKLEQKIESNPEIKEIIEDAEVLKNNIQNLPKSVVAKRLAKIQVKVKRIGIKFFLDVVDVAYKEAIKLAL